MGGRVWVLPQPVSEQPQYTRCGEMTDYTLTLHTSLCDSSRVTSVIKNKEAELLLTNSNTGSLWKNRDAARKPAAVKSLRRDVSHDLFPLGVSFPLIYITFH